MAIILRGRSRCALCDEVLAEGQLLFSTSAFLDRDHPLWRYSDAAMHHSCFDAWPDRRSFIDSFNEFWSRNYRGMRFMHDDGSVEEREPEQRRR